MICEFIIWETTFGELLVALGTGALAAFTFVLARKTGREVEITEESLNLSRESIEALDRPFVIATPAEGNRDIRIDKSATDRELKFRLWNIGKGPAIVRAIGLTSSGGTELVAPGPGPEIPVAAGQGHDLSVAVISTWSPSPGENLTLILGYRSAAGIPYQTSSKARLVSRHELVCSDYTRSPEPAQPRPT